MIAAAVYIRIEDVRGQEETIRVDILSKRVQEENLSISVGFQEQVEKTIANITITVESIMILDRFEVASNIVYNETFEKQLAEEVDVIVFENLTMVHPNWMYRVMVRCGFQTYQNTEDVFYIFTLRVAKEAYELQS
jgi:hypothetical protein